MHIILFITVLIFGFCSLYLIKFNCIVIFIYLLWKHKISLFLYLYLNNFLFYFPPLVLPILLDPLYALFLEFSSFVCEYERLLEVYWASLLYFNWKCEYICYIFVFMVLGGIWFLNSKITYRILYNIE